MATANVIVKLLDANCISAIILFPDKSTIVTRGIKENEWLIDTLD
jgi:hypothetical protein